METSRRAPISIEVIAVRAWALYLLNKLLQSNRKQTFQSSNFSLTNKLGRTIEKSCRWKLPVQWILVRYKWVGYFYCKLTIKKIVSYIIPNHFHHACMWAIVVTRQFVVNLRNFIIYLHFIVWTRTVVYFGECWNTLWLAKPNLCHASVSSQATFHIY